MANKGYGDFLYGLRDIKITNMAGTLQEDLDAAQTLSFTPEFTTAEQRGDDVVKSAIGFLSGGSATITNGAISSAANAIMFGKSLTVAGSSPNETATMQVNAGDSLPYFKVYGQTWDDDTGDIHIYLGKCKIIGGGALEFGDGAYVTYSLELKVLDDGTNGIWKQIQHETRTTLPTS